MWIDRESLDLIRRRRSELRARLGHASFEELEESCVPSYCHRNPLAAAVSWGRLLAARSLYRRHGIPGPLLDFGAGSGELFHLLESEEPYHFVEESDLLATEVTRRIPHARRERLAALPRAHFASIFALDALEHNEDVPGIVAALVASLRPEGRLFVSGPTETLLYRLGRRAAGFGGHYHKTTIFEIEATLARTLHRIGLRSLPPGIALFRLSVWNLA